MYSVSKKNRKIILQEKKKITKYKKLIKVVKSGLMSKLKQTRVN